MEHNSIAGTIGALIVLAGIYLGIGLGMGLIMSGLTHGGLSWRDIIWIMFRWPGFFI